MYVWNTLSHLDDLGHSLGLMVDGPVQHTAPAFVQMVLDNSCPRILASLSHARSEYYFRRGYRVETPSSALPYSACQPLESPSAMLDSRRR